MGVELRSTRHAINCRSSPAGFSKMTLASEIRILTSWKPVSLKIAKQNSKVCSPWILEWTRIIHVGEGLQILKGVLQQPTGPKPGPPQQQLFRSNHMKTRCGFRWKSQQISIHNYCSTRHKPLTILSHGSSTHYCNKPCAVALKKRMELINYRRVLSWIINIHNQRY